MTTASTARVEGPEEAPTDRRPLSRERIIDAAMDLIENRCLDDLSMRRLGAQLGCEAMSLYRYFPSKGALLDAITEEVVSIVGMPDEESDWETAVRSYARAFRAMARKHPRLYPLLANCGPAHPAIRVGIERMDRIWRRAGLDAEAAKRAQFAVQGYLMGWAMPAVTEPVPATGTGDSTENDELAPRAGVWRDSDADFEWGLEVVLAGLRHRLAGQLNAAAH